MKVTVFALSAALAGFGGVLLATTTGRVTNVDFAVELGFLWLAAVVVFGVRRPAGAVLAGLALAVSPELLRVLSPGSLLPPVVFGLAALGLARNPDGVLGTLDARRAHDRGSKKVERSPLRNPDPGEGRSAEKDPPALALAGVRAGYGDAEVVHGVDLVVPAGSVVALVGPNGAGKSTLCRLAAGLIAPTGGRIHLAGVDVTTEAPHLRARRGAFLIPEGRGVFPGLTVDENLAVWLAGAADRDQAYDRFPRLAERRQQPAGSLSGGEQQMLALAAALVRPPALLVVDEPSLGLAPLIVEQVYAAVREIRGNGSAVLLVEEKARDVLAVADTVVMLDIGTVGWTAPAAEVDEDRLARSYLGPDTPIGSGP
jgi:ABC-type branched-subunit amino acid transport system ATPase component